MHDSSSCGCNCHHRKPYRSLVQLFTKAWTAGLLNGLGDAVSQKFVEKNDEFNFQRLGIFTLLVRPTHECTLLAGQHDSCSDMLQ